MFKSVALTTLFALTLGSVAYASVDISPEKLKKIEDTIDSSDITQLATRTLTGGELRGQARSDYKKLYKTWSPDYPPVAYLARIEETDLLVIYEMNDGGGEIDLYTLNGEYIAGGSAGESSPMRWDR